MRSAAVFDKLKTQSREYGCDALIPSTGLTHPGRERSHFLSGEKVTGTHGGSDQRPVVTFTTQEHESRATSA